MKTNGCFKNAENERDKTVPIENSEYSVAEKPPPDGVDLAAGWATGEGAEESTYMVPQDEHGADGSGII